MRILIFVAISSLFSCAGMPQKPVLEMCFLESAGSPIQGDCGLTGGKSITKASQLEYTKIKKSVTAVGQKVPIADLDGSVMFRPDEYEKLHNYLQELEWYAQHK